MTVEIFLESIIAALLIGGSLLLLFWKRSEKKLNDFVIRRIGVCVALIGFYKFSNVMFLIAETNSLIFSFNKLFELFGLTILMFGLFKFMEAKK